MTTMELTMRTPNVARSLLLWWVVLSLTLIFHSHEVAASSSETAESSSTASSSSSCACGSSSSLVLPPRPDVSSKAETARWMVRVLDWGTLSTISTRFGGDNDGDQLPVPFGNVYSFVDGTCDKSTGVPYIYGTYLDQTFIDTKQNAKVSLTLSEASLSSVCTAKHGLDSCTLGKFC